MLINDPPATAGGTDPLQRWFSTFEANPSYGDLSSAPRPVKFLPWRFTYINPPEPTRRTEKTRLPTAHLVP